MKEKNLQKTYEKIDEISGELGIKEGEKTIFEIVPTSDPNQMSLSLKSALATRRSLPQRPKGKF